MISNKSQGYDEVNPGVLKNCRCSLSVPLTIIFLSSIQNEEIPKEWKYANVTPIHKRGSRVEAGNYRPVSLTSIVCKVIERIIRYRIMEHLKDNNLLSNYQHVNNRACNTNLLICQDLTTLAIQNDGAIDILYTDFSKAFDIVSHKKLITKMEAYGIKGKIPSRVKAFLEGRKQRVVMGETVSEWVDVLSGVSQE